MDAATDTLLTVGENGVLYTCKLHTSYDPQAGTLSLNPDPPEKYTYTATGYGESDNKRWWGMEDSLTIWRNYGFFADNGGYLQCVDLNTLELLYVSDVGDDQDATMVLEEAPAEGTIYLYGGNKVSSRGATDGVGETIHRKIDGLTGETLWSYSIPAALDEGTMATPHVGKGDLEDLVIFACSDVSVTVEGQAQYGGRQRQMCIRDRLRRVGNGGWPSPIWRPACGPEQGHRGSGLAGGTDLRLLGQPGGDL